jgi:hypothetical protein
LVLPCFFLIYSGALRHHYFREKLGSSDISQANDGLKICGNVTSSVTVGATVTDLAAPNKIREITTLKRL